MGRNYQSVRGSLIKAELHGLGQRVSLPLEVLFKLCCLSAVESSHGLQAHDEGLGLLRLLMLQLQRCAALLFHTYGCFQLLPDLCEVGVELLQLEGVSACVSI